MIESTLSTLIPATPIPDTLEDYEDIRADHERAAGMVKYVVPGRIVQSYYGTGLPSKITSHAFVIDRDGELDHRWLVVGDCPGAIFDLSEATNPIDAIEHYMSEIDGWVRAIHAATV